MGRGGKNEVVKRKESKGTDRKKKGKCMDFTTAHEAKSRKEREEELGEKRREETRELREIVEQERSRKMELGVGRNLSDGEENEERKQQEGKS